MSDQRADHAIVVDPVDHRRPAANQAIQIGREMDAGDACQGRPRHGDAQLFAYPAACAVGRDAPARAHRLAARALDPEFHATGGDADVTGGVSRHEFHAIGLGGARPQLLFEAVLRIVRMPRRAVADLFGEFDMIVRHRIDAPQFGAGQTLAPDDVAQVFDRCTVAADVACQRGIDLAPDFQRTRIQHMSRRVPDRRRPLLHQQGLHALLIQQQSGAQTHRPRADHHHVIVVRRDIHARHRASSRISRALPCAGPRSARRCASDT